LATPLAKLEGKYEILEKIREGGMGAVYKVRHRLLEEVRVVKVMRPHLAEDEVLQARFLREAKVAIKLRHKNLAQIYDFTVDDSGYAYLVMEFIDGLNLQEVVKVLDKPGLGLVLEIARQSLEALGYLHRKRIIHRDVSPDNLLVTRDDEGALLVKIIDLGIAKVRGGDDSLTSEGTFLGKVRYSSPEHFQTKEGSGVTAASDLYSFGVVLYEMLTGMYPIKGTSVASLISGHIMHPPLDFDESDPDGRVPEELRTVLHKALDKDPKKRFGSSASFTKALQPWIDEYPLDTEEFQVIFDMPTLTTHKIRTVKKPGSTQSRFDRSFGLSTTPPPDATRDGDTEFETSGTVETGSAGRAQKVTNEDSRQAQIRALLIGAGKLAEAEHFEEARMQLASVLDIDADNAEAQELLKAVDEADVELQNKRQDAAESVRLLLRAESFDQAETQLRKAVKELGQAEIFDTVKAEIDAAREALEKRRREVEGILRKATELMKKEGFEEAVPLIRGGLDLEPGNRDLIARLEDAEKGLEALLEARRRAKEIEKTVATIADHIEHRDPDQAEHALKLAEKLYGAEEAFADLSGRIEDLRTELRLEKVEGLRDQARQEIEKDEFAAAITILQDAAQLAPEAEETAELLSEAREGLRLQEEARKRQIEIDASVERIDRLIVAGRFDSAVQAIDMTIAEHGDFDEAPTLRKRVSKEAASAEKINTKATSLLDQALEHAAGDSFAKAGDFLDQAKSLATDHPQLGELIAEAETEVSRRIEAHRRQMAIHNVTESIQKQLDKGSVEEAQRELGVARRLYGESDVLDELGATIDARQRELRSKEIQTLIKSARKKNRPSDEAIADLEAALSIDPHCEEAHRLLVETRATEKRAKEEELARDCESLLATIDELIAEGDPARALEVLDTMVRDFGDFRRARDLRRTLEGLR
jgi:serine/threonine protein kinase/tetratricopeptide (TPR) repeat protein